MEILSVLEATCKDCHRCVRYCPTGAIGFDHDQAWIIHEKCIYCGRCINACPQGAKVPWDGTQQLEDYLVSGQPVIASVAPSFIATLDVQDYRQLVGGLKALGFAHVTETVHGASYVAAEYLRLARTEGKPLISACCPTIVNYVEKHCPEMIPYLAPVISPMMVHGRILREQFGPQAKIVFVGPCLAKMDELTRPEAKGGVDLVLTFRQLNKLFAKRKIDLSAVAPAEFDATEAHWPRMYPIRGGAVSAALLEKEFGEENVLAVSGIDECIQTLNDLREGRINPVFLEMLACPSGCINGPEVDISLGTATRRQMVVKYSKERLRDGQIASQSGEPSIAATPVNSAKPEYLPPAPVQSVLSVVDLYRTYTDRKQSYPMPDEAEIREILQRIGKFSKDDESNCGGCGYPSCREKAIAVYQGFAEEKMCIPYMKRRIESLADIIVESSHNAIIVVDKEMVIHEFNPVAHRMFTRKKESPIGQPLYRYIDPRLFQQVWSEKTRIIHKRVKYEQYQLVTDQTIFPIEEYGVIIGIFTDMSGEEEQREKVRQMKKFAVEKAADVVHKQMKIVQEIAGLLGETTVETKAALYELTELIEDGESN